MMDLFGNIQQQQEEIAKKLKEVIIDHASDEGLITIKVNGAKELLDIRIDREKFSVEMLEQLEDLLVVTFNEAFEKANIEAEKVSQQAINDLLPGGLGSMGGLFGQ